jgi:hypothetical protein
MVLEEVPMAIVGGLDLHRKQITFDVLDTVSGEVRRGRISPADRQLFRGWLAGLAGQHVELAVEGCTGWRFVIEECQAAGVVAHLAEPAEVAGLRGRRRHAKTDRIDARHLRDLLLEGRLPECWIPPQLVLETRAKVRLYKDLADQRTGWQQRMHATLYHLGAPAQRDLLSGDRDRLARIEGLSASKDRAARPSPAPAGHPNRSSCRRTDEGSRTKISRGARGPAGMILARQHHAPLLAGVKVVRPYGALHLDADCGATPHTRVEERRKNDHELTLDRGSRHR